MQYMDLVFRDKRSACRTLTSKAFAVVLKGFYLSLTDPELWVMQKT